MTTASGWAGPTWRREPVGSRRLGRWLDACLRRRPDDPAVWRARLDWARAAEDEAEVRRALAHLPADHLPPRPGARPARLVRSPGRRRRARATLPGGTHGTATRGAIWAIERLAELLPPGRPARRGRATARA